MLDRLRDRAKESTASTPLHKVALVSSPGYGVLDSGCGRAIISADTLDAFQKIWDRMGMPTPEFVSETHQFKFGNGDVETSSKVVLMPVTLAGRKGIIRASIVGGEAPLLMSRSAFKKLRASLGFGRDTLKLKLFGQEVRLQANLAGQYVVHLVADVGESTTLSFAEVMANDRQPEFPDVSDELPARSGESPPDVPVQADASPQKAQQEDSPLNQVGFWVQDNSGANKSHDGPSWDQVVRRVVRSACSFKVTADHSFASGTNQKHSIHTLPVKEQHVITEFHFVGPARFANPSRMNAEKSRWKPNPTARQDVS